jgi:hypothetical protein
VNESRKKDFRQKLKSKKRSLKTPLQGIVASLEGMKKTRQRRTLHSHPKFIDSG